MLLVAAIYSHDRVERSMSWESAAAEGRWEVSNGCWVTCWFMERGWRNGEEEVSRTMMMDGGGDA
eukprot:CCRYP_005202-RA/>CCRYP_005202-RA protein AED:0.49 eAED:1.00 QI:0/0/0/1/0/0/2/0/64